MYCTNCTKSKVLSSFMYEEAAYGWSMWMCMQATMYGRRATVVAVALWSLFCYVKNIKIARKGRVVLWAPFRFARNTPPRATRPRTGLMCAMNNPKACLLRSLLPQQPSSQPASNSQKRAFSLPKSFDATQHTAGIYGVLNGVSLWVITL